MGQNNIKTGEKKQDPIHISIMDYDATQIFEKDDASVEDCLSLRQTSTVSWIKIERLSDPTVIKELGQHFEIHPLLLEDVLNPNRRPMFDDGESCLFVIVNVFRYSESTSEITSDQVNLILGSNYVISLQEKSGDVFDPIRIRLRNSRGKVRQRGADYLFYLILDAVVDSYFTILDDLGDRIETLEEELMTDPTQDTLHSIYVLKREMAYLRRNIRPVRELTAGLERIDSELIGDNTSSSLRYLHGHTIHVIDMLESYRDLVSSMLDLYLNSVSHRMNKIMHVLTIVATIFLPLTFIAGIYGMNFPNMPELKWRHGYYVICGVMIIIAVGMVVFFKVKGWI